MCADDGMISFIVTERLENSIRTTVQNNGMLGENKGITFPQHTIEDLPALSAQDKLDVLFAIEQMVDYVSVSCMRDIEDVEELRYWDLIQRLVLGNTRIKMLAKIENKRGMDNFESILRMADGIVLDRGYLGSEVDVDLVVIGQKRSTST
jgi:pyruvate kinase